MNFLATENSCHMPTEHSWMVIVSQVYVLFFFCVRSEEKSLRKKGKKIEIWYLITIFFVCFFNMLIFPDT